MDALLITFLNAAACLVLPKFLSMLLASKNSPNQPSAMDSQLHPQKIEITSFPYCTAYGLTGTQFCRFRPLFCSKCSPS